MGGGGEIQGQRQYDPASGQLYTMWNGQRIPWDERWRYFQRVGREGMGQAFPQPIPPGAWEQEGHNFNIKVIDPEELMYRQDYEKRKGKIKAKI